MPAILCCGHAALRDSRGLRGKDHKNDAAELAVRLRGQPRRSRARNAFLLRPRWSRPCCLTLCEGVRGSCCEVHFGEGGVTCTPRLAYSCACSALAVHIHWTIMCTVQAFPVPQFVLEGP